jgi:HAE1 family hydrophobic/amphiphilic exporter-1
MPIALIGTIAGIYLAGFSLNILTLLALVLATGLVVDDSIVVLENIVRRRSLGMPVRAPPPCSARRKCSSPSSPPRRRLQPCFVPLSFLPGQTGRLFREFGFTLAIAVALSAIVALTMGPMLASRFLKAHDRAQEDTSSALSAAP